LPLVTASEAGDEFGAMQILRSQSPLLARDNLSGVDVAGRLGELRQLTETVQRMMEPESCTTNADVLRLIHKSNVIALDPRVLSYLNLPIPVRPKEKDNAEVSEEEEDGEELTKEVAAMDAFLACPAFQFRGYYKYLNDDSPFSTQQGIKGAEFERVLVVLDDDEGTHVQFSYDKYLGIKQLSDRDEANRREGKETTIDRTRRLFYVCCTRAMKDLVVVLFTAEVAIAKSRIASLQLFPAHSIHLEDEISAD
jgi:DNA helicase-2/ATP-dependent DNA helicase PcrA